jgi:hypothetical protein
VAGDPAGRRATGPAHALGQPQVRVPFAGRWVVACAALVVLALVVGGYGMGWRWTGLSRGVTLWDWLQALLLPVALGLTPVLLLQRDRLRRLHAALILTGLALAAVLVAAGYLVPLTWTGFPGHTLWDWFELALLPLVVTAAPIWVKANRIRRMHLLLGTGAGLAFGAFVLAGYAVPLAWTGFSDNTAWDWLKLLLLPVLLPTVVIPLLSAMMQRSLAGPPSSPEATTLAAGGERAVRG